MMQLRYDDELLEEAVFERASRRSGGPPSLQVRRFHAQREKLYSILEAEERNTAFFKLHLEWFREWGLEKAILDVVDEFPRLRARLNTLVFRKARSKDDEGVELYVGPENNRVGVVALRLDRFHRPDEPALFLRHELTHLDDMINPAFGYSPQLDVPGLSVTQQRLTRERYRLLWDISIDGRLAGLQRCRTDSREARQAAFDRAFGFWSENRREEVFAALWGDRHPCHANLLAIASDPRELRQVQAPAPGAACPLCGFATFSWADTEQMEPATRMAIEREFPDWTIQQGACGRCAEIYRLVGAQIQETA